MLKLYDLQQKMIMVIFILSYVSFTERLYSTMHCFVSCFIIKYVKKKDTS